MVAAGLLAQEGRRARPDAPSRGSRPRLAPGSRVVTDYLERAGLTSRWSSSASTSSATAAPPASATPARCPRRLQEVAERDLVGRRGAVRQPQLRGPHPSRRASRTTWPRRRWSSPTRWRARWTSTWTPSRSAPTPTASRSFCTTSGRSSDEIAEAIGRRVHVGDVPQQLRRRSSTATRTGSTLAGAEPATATTGTRSRPTSSTRRTSRACRTSRRRSTDIAGARVLAVLGDSVTTDHISPAGSIKRDSPAGAYLHEHGVERGRLQLLRRAARQPRGDGARHVRQHPAAQPAGARAPRAASRAICPTAR